jgi:hypothetical protein
VSAADCHNNHGLCFCPHMGIWPPPTEGGEVQALATIFPIADVAAFAHHLGLGTIA